MSSTLLYDYPTVEKLLSFFEPQNKSTDELISNKPINEDIAIIGIACNFPKSPNIQEFWQTLLNGQDCISQNSIRFNKPIYGGFIDGIEYFDND